MKLKYAVEADFRPFKRWYVEAESESEARLLISEKTKIKYDELSAYII